MHFLQMFNPPVEVVLKGNGSKEFPDLLLIVPKYKLSDAVAWGNEIRGQIIKEVTSEMDDTRRREYLTFYPVTVDLSELKRRLRTPEGITRVVKYCLLRADCFTYDAALQKKGQARPKLQENHVSYLTESAGPGRLAGLAWILADLDETQIFRDPSKDLSGDKDPLTRSGKTARSQSDTTGPSDSPNGTPPIPDSIPETSPSPSSNPFSPKPEEPAAS